MKQRRFFLILAILMVCTFRMQAQWDPAISHYWTIKGFYNPSFAGETDQIRASGIYRLQWTGIQSAPQILIATSDMPFEFLGRRHGFGIVAFSENIGRTRNNLLAAQYAFRRKIGKSSLAFGVQAGMYNLTFDAGSLHTTTDSIKNNIPVIRANMTEKKALDLNAGISWSGRSFYTGLSALHLTEPWFYARRDSIAASDAHTDSTRLHIPRSFNFIAAYNIRLFNPLEIQPMVWIQSDLAVTKVQATLRLVYNNKFSGGASWVKDDGYVFFAGAVIQGIDAGYAYSLHTSGIGKESKGSHEVYLRY
ncbi:MAG: PorP/SprF family type IX secretion system membrane protein, partial [Petrimonas sp.]|nr:PorP/SprF family type IX secretion system membrane protein [Petrimonas sp.]